MNDKELASKLFRVVSEYNPEGLKMVKKAYEMAYEAHDGQKRKTGEPYIIHPIWVALILTDLKVDTDTLCAALLHDTVEDTNITLEKIEKEFNKEVATLVDGVTRISKLKSNIIMIIDINSPFYYLFYNFNINSFVVL